jgi:hypothetical protein
MTRILLIGHSHNDGPARVVRPTPYLAGCSESLTGPGRGEYQSQPGGSYTGRSSDTAPKGESGRRLPPRPRNRSTDRRKGRKHDDWQSELRNHRRVV